MASITSATSTATTNTAMITVDPVVFGVLMVVLGGGFCFRKIPTWILEKILYLCARFIVVLFHP